MMLREGINRARDLFSTDTDDGQFGTGSTAEQITNTALGSAVAATLVDTTSTTASQFLVKGAEINSVTGNSTTYTEFGLIDGTDSTLMNRVTFTGLAKTNLLNMRSRVRYFFK